MGIRIVPYEAGYRAAIQHFNRRLAGGSVDPELRLPEAPDPEWLPGTEIWLAVEGEEVRGGYLLRRQMFSIGGKTHPVAHYRLPLSEGLINRAYVMLGGRLARDALAHEPRLYALGMGGWQRPLPQMLQRLNWRMVEVPFFFKVPHPYAFLRGASAVRGSRLARWLCDVAAFSGAGWLAMKAAGVARRTRGTASFEMPPRFEGWADPIWENSRPHYGMAAVRDAAALDRIYPPDNARFLRVRAVGGWAVLVDTQMRGHKQFGDLRVGTIADCLAPDARSAEAVVGAAAGILEERGVDLIVSNQLHRHWRAALEEAGFRQGPSNFLLGLSPALAALVSGCRDDELHINRGDGDGPIHL